MFLLNCLSPGIELWPLFYIWSKKTCEAPQSLASPAPLPSPIPSWVTIPFNILEQITKCWFDLTKQYWRHLAKNLLCTAGSKCESKGGRSYLGKTFLYHPHWTWGKDVGHSQYIIIYIKSLTCISQCDMFSSCPSPAWLGWSGQLSRPFLFTSFLDFYFSISAWLSPFVFFLEPYFLNGIWYFDNHQFISCHDAMMSWCNDASTTECLKGVAAWGEEVEAKQATDWALRCLTDQRPDV